LLELADEGFLELKTLTTNIEKHYEIEVKNGDLNVDIDLLSLEVYFKSTHILDDFVEAAKKAGFEDIDSDLIYNDFDKLSKSTTKLINALNKLEINKIKELDYILNNKIENPYQILYICQEKSNKYNLSKKINPYTILLLLILYIFKEKLNEEKLKEMGFSEKAVKIIKDSIIS
jgi:hypothetical protein